jgi:L-fucose isomerase-like protein
MKNKLGFVCFGEVNTPFERLEILHDEALQQLKELKETLPANDEQEIIDAGIVIDDPAYNTATEALKKLEGNDLYCMVVCVAGWVPTHAVIRVTDMYRNVPMLLWGLCGWKENGKIITTAPQAGTTAIRPAFEAMGYRFKFVYNTIGEKPPLDKIGSFIKAAYGAKKLRSARVGTMGYRDMLLYGTQFEGNSMRAQLGVEIEPFETLEMQQNLEKLDAAAIADGVAFVKNNWKFEKPCADETISTGVKYALAIGNKIKERGYEAVTLIDVDGMKKLLGFPPAMVFMLLDHYYGVQTIPENDCMGAVTQLMLGYLTGQRIPYLEYYEFFKNSMLIGVPDFIPSAATAGDVKVLPTAFGLLSASLLNVSEVKTGYVTCARLVYKNGSYYMHFYTGTAEAPPDWAEFGWADPAPHLPSLRISPDSCTVEEFSQKVSSQHVLVCYGDHSESLRDLCSLLDIKII